MYVHSPPRGPSSVHPRLSGARKMVLANLRVQHGPLVATLVEGHHEGALHAACGRSRVPGVMTTTLRVNAHHPLTVQPSAPESSAGVVVRV